MNLSRRRRQIELLAGRIKPGTPADPSEVDDKTEEVDLSKRTVYAVQQGVTIRWLAIVFAMTDHMVKTRLKTLAPISVGGYNQPLYSVPEAAALLVEPKTDLKDFLTSIKEDDLPDDLRLKFWNARRARNKVLQEEGEHFHQADVMAKFSEMLLSVREKLQLIPEKVERMTGITPEQYKLIRGAVDAVQEEMYKAILEMADNDNTQSVLGDEEDEVVL